MKNALVITLNGIVITKENVITLKELFASLIDINVLNIDTLEIEFTPTELAKFGLSSRVLQIDGSSYYHYNLDEIHLNLADRDNPSILTYAMESGKFHGMGRCPYNGNKDTKRIDIVVSTNYTEELFSELKS